MNDGFQMFHVEHSKFIIQNNLQFNVELFNFETKIMICKNKKIQPKKGCILEL